MIIALLSIILVIASLMLMVLVLLHRGKGGGLSSMFGGSLYSSLSGSSVVERNLDRLTIIAGVVWAICIVGLSLLYKAG
jgi:preprotein translocase subunit SecG